MIRFCSIVSIIMYAVIYELLYLGAHLKSRRITGVWSSILEHPTRECSTFDLECQAHFKPASELPYCLAPSVPVITASENSTPKLPCSRLDAASIGRNHREGYFVATRVRTYWQMQSPCALDMMSTDCGRVFEFIDADANTQSGSGRAHPVNETFIADVERFTFVIDHNIDWLDGAVFNDGDMAGFWYVGDKVYEVRPQNNSSNESLIAEDSDEENSSAPAATDNKETETSQLPSDGNHQNETQEPSAHTDDTEDTQDTGGGHDGLAQLRTHIVSMVEAHGAKVSVSEGGRLRSRVTPTKDTPLEPSGPQPWDDADSGASVEGDAAPVVQHADGDAFTIATLLRMANVSLDSVRPDGSTVRARGVELLLRIVYTNNKPWVGLHITPWKGRVPSYSYKVSAHSTRGYKFWEENPPDHTGVLNFARVLKDYHGVQINVEQEGEVLEWDTTRAIIVIVTSLGLISVVNLVVDTYMLTFSKRSRAYEDVYYQTAPSLDSMTPGAGSA